MEDFDEYDGLLQGYDFGYVGSPQPVTAKYHKEELTADEVRRWAAWTKPFPLPEYMTPEGPQLFEKIDDETLLKVPPHLLVHLQRTASQGGLQVISPRQIPSTCLLAKTMTGERTVTDYIVGSTAASDSYWPTLDDDDEELAHWLPDEPIPAVGDTAVIRHKTRTEPLTSAASLLKDPVLACLVKGRAVIDILRRPDVAGDAEAMTHLLADAWGIEPEVLMEMDAYTLGIEGDLLRHAIVADDVYPMVHAPIHKKMSVGVGYSEVTRDYLPEFCAMDWRRMRVVAEAIFLMACSIEAVPLRAIRCWPPPGDPTAPIGRRHTLAFHPLPCTAWSFEPKSFSVCPVYTRGKEPLASLAPEVADALSKYLRHARPISRALEVGHRAVATKSLAIMPTDSHGETLSSAFSVVTRGLATGGARGRTASAAVRNVIYETLEDAPLKTRLRLTRYIHIALREVRTHLSLTEIPDEIIHTLAIKFVSIGEAIRNRVAAEATRRGYTVGDWWDDITAQVPTRYAELREGTMGWAQVGMWLLFREPTERWTALEKAVHFSALREAELNSIGGIALPPVRGSGPRLEAASRAAVSRITTAFSGYYMAVADVGHSIADLLQKDGKERSAETMREGSHLWVLRARCLRGTNAHLIAKDEPTPSENHMRIRGPSMDVILKPAPYRAFLAYKTHVAGSKLISHMVKKQIAEFKEPRISKVFTEIVPPIVPAKASVITRYLVDPKRLASDMEKAWANLRKDMDRVMLEYGAAELPTVVPRNVAERFVIPVEMYVPPVIPDRGGTNTYYSLMREMDPDELEWFEDMIFRMDKAEVQELMDRPYADITDLRNVFDKLDKDMMAMADAARESVR